MAQTNRQTQEEYGQTIRQTIDRMCESQAAEAEDWNKNADRMMKIAINGQNHTTTNKLHLKTLLYLKNVLEFEILF